MIGASRIILRASVAGPLNAAHPDVTYATDTSTFIDLVNHRLASGYRNFILTLATRIDRWNNMNCVLN